MKTSGKENNEKRDQLHNHQAAPGICDGAAIARRDFVPSAGAALAAFTILPRHVLGGAGFVAPSDKLNIAGVGVGGMGGEYLKNCQSENIMALADVDHDFAAKTFARYPNASRYKDFRVMLEKEKSIDAVIIGTPDHTHAVVAMAAIKLGKHVYCAKPMCRTIYEVREVTRAAREAKVATQMSTQSAASEAACATAEMLQSGVIGNVREVHMSSDRPIWPQGLARPAETVPVPPNMDWDLWIGPAAPRPFSPFYHPFNWRGWYDFGTGALGDMALHEWHFFWNALRLTYPTKISSSIALATEGTRVGGGNAAGGAVRIWARKVKYPETFPHAEIITFEFPARGEMPPLRLFWYDGGLLPPRPEGLDLSLRAPTQYYVGEKGVLVPARGVGGAQTASASGQSGAQRGPGGQRGGGQGAGAASSGGPSAGFILLAGGKLKDFTPPPKTISRTIGHYQEWIAAAKGGKPANCNFAYGSLFAETALLGVIAVRTGKDLAYDPQNIRFTNDADANQYLNPPYRSGWSL